MSLKFDNMDLLDTLNDIQQLTKVDTMNATAILEEIDEGTLNPEDQAKFNDFLGSQEDGDRYQDFNVGDLL